MATDDYSKMKMDGIEYVERVVLAAARGIPVSDFSCHMALISMAITLGTQGACFEDRRRWSTQSGRRRRSVPIRICQPAEGMMY